MVEKVQEEFLNTAEVAALAGIKMLTLQTYRKRGYGPVPVRAGTGVYRRSDVEAWLASRPGRGYRTDLHRGK